MSISSPLLVLLYMSYVPCVCVGVCGLWVPLHTFVPMPIRSLLQVCACTLSRIACVCVCACLRVTLHQRHTHTHTPSCFSACILTCVCMCVHVCACVCMCVCVCVCVCVQQATSWATARARRDTQAPTARRVRVVGPAHSRQHRARQRAARVSAVGNLFLGTYSIIT